MSRAPTAAPTADSMPAGTTQGAPQVLLAHHLKQLKLPTVLREYDKVAREAAHDGVDHPRYLLRLVELCKVAPKRDPGFASKRDPLILAVRAALRGAMA